MPFRMPRPFTLPAKGLPVQYRSLEIRREWIDEKHRTIEFPFSSTTPIERWYAFEVLSHEPGAIDTERLTKAGCLLENHNWDVTLGAIEKAWVEKNERAWCRARFSKNPHPEEVFRDVLDEIKRNVSVGYVLDEYEMVNPDPETEEDALPTILVTRWTPHEISIVSVPADYKNVGLGREQEEGGKVYAVRSAPSGHAVKKIVTDRKVIVTTENGDVREAEQKRCTSIMLMGTRFGCEDAARRAVEANESAEQFQGWVLANRFNAQPVATNQDLGLTTREVRNYSIVKAIRELSDLSAGPKLTGLELEASNAMAQLLKRQPKGFFLPPEIVRGPSVRDLSMTAPPTGPGSHLVGTELQSLIELLRNWLRVREAGARILNGLSGNLAFPKQTGGATCYWLTETEAITETAPAFAQVPMAPKRLGSWTTVSRQLVTQASVDVEMVIREDLAKSMATELDRTALFGSGVGTMPRGIINQTGINRWEFGATELFDGYVRAVVAIDDARVLLDSGAWISNPRSWGAGISTPKFPNTGITVIADNNTLLGYPFLKTQQIPNSGVNEGLVFFGNWSDLMIGNWDTTDLVVDPYSLAQNAQIRVIMNQWWDIAVRYPEAFAVSEDPGYPPDMFPRKSSEVKATKNQPAGK